MITSVAGYMTGLVGSSNNPISERHSNRLPSMLILLQMTDNEGMAAKFDPSR